jgi:hypothetical protein
MLVDSGVSDRVLKAGYKHEGIDLVAVVRAGAVFHKGPLERPVDITPAQPDESTETEVA